MINTSKIYNLLKEREGRYVFQDSGVCRIKESNGSDVIIDDHPLVFDCKMMDELQDQNLVTYANSKYTLPEILPPIVIDLS